MKNIERNLDVITGCDDLEFLYEFNAFPVFMGCTEELSDTDILVDMRWSISKGSGMIQLDSLLPLEVLYSKSHGSGDVGNVWNEHHQSFAKFISRYKPKSILEIGGGHGILSYEYQKIDLVNWTIVEPNPSPSKHIHAEFIECFFDDKFTFEASVDAIVHSHVFEHVYNPRGFISDISNFLEEGQKLIFTLPNMEEMLKRKHTNCLNFEHTVFLTEPYMDYLLSNYGFRQVGKEYFKEDHSIFYAFVKDSNVETIKLPSGLYDHNKTLFFNYIEYYKKEIESLNKNIGETKNGRHIYLFGAHIFSQYLIEFGLNTANIVCILDNDVNKQGKRLYGTEIMVCSPKILSDINNPIIILKAGVYNEEVKNDITNDINEKCIFWE